MQGSDARQPCAVKMLPYNSEDDVERADAELEALWDTHELSSVLTCLGVFLDVAADGARHLQILTE